MSRSKHHSRSISQILTIGLLSSCAMLIVSMLSHCFALLRLLKNIFKRKESKEKANETPYTPITNSEESLASSPKVEPEPQPVTTKVEPEPQPIATTIEAYCVKCRQKQLIQGARKVITQKGRHALEGTCPICGTKLFRFIAREKEKTSG